MAAGGWFYPLPVIILEHAFPPMGFSVAWLGCSLHNFLRRPVANSVDTLRSSVYSKRNDPIYVKRLLGNDFCKMYQKDKSNDQELA